ncbi:MAG TPA: tRNA (N6-threonylcarbamoyladenosine(37)-N6)-methyltransferase TrmO [Catenuloplanes sp.]
MANPVGPMTTDYNVRRIGRVRSPLTDLDAAPKQGAEGAPDAWIDYHPDVAAGFSDLAVGDRVLVLTWLHHADRDVLRVHPRGDPRNPETGVFGTRSPHRPNPIGLHPVTVTGIAPGCLRVGPLEAVDGTPVIDVKSLSSSPRPGPG